MRREHREMAADWMIVLGGLTLFASLFLTWSHQFSKAFLDAFGTADQLQGVARDATAWQVFSSMDVVLALLALGLLGAALAGSRTVRLVALAAAVVGLVFVLHALGTPPTNGANIFNPALSVPSFAPTGATAGAGETVALVGLGVAIAGLGLGFTPD
ncbi:MAG TPA: hypothetical protein VGI87_03210 [Solirubrobacteraceae bacterium]